MTKLMADDKLCFEKRKEQAAILGIEVTEDISLEVLEKEITIKLEEGMRDLKEIMDEITGIEPVLN